jgi:hypothetical protein
MGDSSNPAAAQHQWADAAVLYSTIQEENRQIRAALAQLQAAAAAAPTAASIVDSSRPSVRVREPDKFDPTAQGASVRIWLFQLQNYFSVVGMTDDRARVNYAVTLLRGAALEWWRQITTLAASHETVHAGNPVVILPTTFAEFAQQIRARFELVTVNKFARTRLRHFKQYGSVADYTAKFLAVCAEIDDISTAEMCDRYLEGLKPEIAEAVAIQQIPDNNFQALVAAAERIDTVKNFRRGRDTGKSAIPGAYRTSGSNPPRNNGVAPMEIGRATIRARGGGNFRSDNRGRNKSPPTCHFCGEVGHFQVDCPQYQYYRKQYLAERAKNPQPPQSKNESRQ